MVGIVSINERKTREAARRAEAAERVSTALSAFARERGGRFLVFGSAARGTMSHNSDLDVLVDFAPDQEHQAFTFLENLCHQAGLTLDAMAYRTMSEQFFARNAADIRVLE